MGKRVRRKRFERKKIAWFFDSLVLDFWLGWSFPSFPGKRSAAIYKIKIKINNKKEKKKKEKKKKKTEKKRWEAFFQATDQIDFTRTVSVCHLLNIWSRLLDPMRFETEVHVCVAFCCVDLIKGDWSGGIGEWERFWNDSAVDVNVHRKMS
jgi:hypothetical protein